MLICLVLCAAAVLPTAFTERPEVPNVQPHPARDSEIDRRLPASYAAARNHGLLQRKLGFERTARNGRDFDTLLGRSFGTSKRDPRGALSAFKKNFDEIDNAGFKDYLYKRNFDEIDSAGFKDDFYKRNFDEIDNAGFQDYLYKRNFDEIDNAGFRDYLFKRNFDEIDKSGFRDYLYKKNLQGTFYPEVRDEKMICTPEGCWSKKFVPANGIKYQREL